MSDDDTTQDSATGFDRVPTRYQTDTGREAIDIIRDSMTDREFAIWCRGQALKYRLRLGKKGPDDADKMAWYEQMASHVLSGGPDPREYRAGSEAYQRAAMPEPLPRRHIGVLDHGYVQLVETWGGGATRLPEAGIVEAARQSTQGSFRGWARDRRLLAYLHEHKHSTPFEFAGLVLEVRAPIFVFREWHRHRTQSFNEMSARYSPLPDLSYLPSWQEVQRRSHDRGQANRQAGVMDGAPEISASDARHFVNDLATTYRRFELKYAKALTKGVPKELARCGMPVGRYSQMRASANLRNWLGFLTLRLDPAAQWEIRQYAEAVYRLITEEFPETAALFEAGR